MRIRAEAGEGCTLPAPFWRGELFAIGLRQRFPGKLLWNETLRPVWIVVQQPRCSLLAVSFPTAVTRQWVGFSPAVNLQHPLQSAGVWQPV